MNAERSTRYLNPTEQKRIVSLAKKGDEQAFNILINSYNGLIRQLANKFTIPSYSAEDLIGEGYLALIKAVRIYNPKVKTTFTTYLYSAVSREMKNAIAEQSRLIRIPRQSQLEIRKRKNVRPEILNNMEHNAIIALSSPIFNSIDPENEQYLDLADPNPPPPLIIESLEFRTKLLTLITNLLDADEANLISEYLGLWDGKGKSMSELAKERKANFKTIEVKVRDILSVLKEEPLVLELLGKGA